ncbi:MAG: invasion associated locus B family protein [Alphaproteobacteria bacterium]|nr:invasion associated locus B family protein [Alphaproteobacteria bacterium]
MTKLHIHMIAAVALATSLLAGSPAMAQESAKVLGTFKDWEAHSFKEGGAKVCNMFSKPAESEGEYTQRGDVYMFVTNRPAAGVVNEFSIQIGYSFKAGAPAYATVGQRKFKLFTQDDFAWLHSDKDQNDMIRAMRGGSTVIVEGFSSRGTKTKDVFSLSGFTAAHNMIGSACKP